MQVIEYSLNVGTEENPSASFTGNWDELNIPEFMLPDSAYGGTDYLDSLQPKDIPEIPIFGTTPSAVKGRDKWERPFVAVHAKVTFLKEDGKELVPDEGRTPKEGMEVYFQRYSDNANIWVSGGRLDLITSNMCERDKGFLEKLLSNGRAVFVREIGMKDDLEYRLVELICFSCSALRWRNRKPWLSARGPVAAQPGK